jgi:serine/threonine-protein kinase
MKKSGDEAVSSLLQTLGFYLPFRNMNMPFLGIPTGPKNAPLLKTLKTGGFAVSNQGQPTAPAQPSRTNTRDEFLRNLHDSGLCTEDELAQFAETYPVSAEAATGEMMVKDLISSGRLTTYQADAVRERRFGDVVIGNYEVLARLGAGGMGTVYKARHRRMKRLVAIKRLSPDVVKKETFVQRFQREVETLAQFNHPNIVMAFDADEDEIGPFLVMEFVNGRDLASDVSENGALAVADAVYCVRQAATGMAFAHAHGVTHRDIKPANLMRDVAGVVKVTDLGLVRLNKADGSAGNSGLTTAGEIFGTIDYMAPEQAIDSSSIDHRADIYSLGGTLFFLLAGRPPYRGNTIMAILLQHRDAPVPSLCSLRPEVPAELDAICQRMLAKKPEERFPSMAEVVRALEAVQPIIAPLMRRPPKLEPAAPANVLNLGATIAADSKSQLDGNTAIARPPLSDQDFWVQEEAPATARLTVVLAEPSRTQAAIMRKYLEESNADNVHTASSGSEAQALVKDCQAHVVISSMHLKDMTGVQLAHALHADPSCAHVGFILTTSEGESAEIGVAMRLPSVTILGKPFDRDQLAAAMARVRPG